MLSSVWGELTYHMLWGYLQCGHSTWSIRARLQPKGYSYVMVAYITVAHLQKQKVVF